MTEVDLATNKPNIINTMNIYSTATLNVTIDTQTPLAVVVNADTASMSEATAGALRDHSRAWNIGQLTFGKGSINGGAQSSISPLFLEYKTISLFYQPNQTTNELVGIIPDFIVPPRFNATENELFAIRNQDRNPELPFKRNEASLEIQLVLTTQLMLFLILIKSVWFPIKKSLFQSS